MLSKQERVITNKRAHSRRALALPSDELLLMANERNERNALGQGAQLRVSEGVMPANGDDLVPLPEGVSRVLQMSLCPDS